MRRRADDAAGDILLLSAVRVDDAEADGRDAGVDAENPQIRTSFLLSS